MPFLPPPSAPATRRSQVLGRFAVLATVALAASDAAAYNFWYYHAGRADYAQAGRYDLKGEAWVKPAAVGATVYDFGNFGMPASFAANLNMDPADVVVAANDAGNAWEEWANVTFGTATGTVATAAVDFAFVSGLDRPQTVANPGGPDGLTNVTIEFGQKAPGGVAWNSDNFEWTVMHELGHVLGLYDLYVSQSEEFVDHPVEGTNRPDLREIGCQDNVMDRVNTARAGACDDGSVNNYGARATTVIDNDEIAAVSWLWGSPYNQIVTGSLAGSWSADGTRSTLPHHGDAADSLGWWTYRGTFSTPGVEPCIDIEFPGFRQYVIETFPKVPVRWDGDLFGDGVQQFCIESDNWTGNFVLKMQSAYTTEGTVDAVLRFNQSVSRIDRFVLDPDPNGLAFQALDDRRALWPSLFGPRVPEPGALSLLGVAAVAGASARRVKRRLCAAA